MNDKKSTGFRRLVLLTIGLIYLVILAGGVVRSTGSGMGCPDWPRCFGKWVPPTNVSQLPSDYKERFKVANHHIADFSVFKTWTEYINRLLGVLVGIFVLLTFVFAALNYGFSSGVAKLSLVILVLTGFQGWIGAKVVFSNLAQHMVTIHMLIALVIMAIALYLLSMVSGFEHSESNIHRLLLFLSVYTLAQILLGTQIRQEIDGIALKYQDGNRELWISELGNNFFIHRIIAMIGLGLNLFVSWYLINKIGFSTVLTKLSVLSTSVYFTEYTMGIWLAKFALPYFIQPMHLLFASIIFGIQFYTWVLSRPQRVVVN
jgi:heme a synthase